MAGEIVTVFGGSGFIGRYVVRRLAKSGCRVRVAVRRPNEALFLKPYGAVGQVVTVLANVRDENSARAAIRGASAVVFCPSVRFPNSRQSFDAVQNVAAGAVARIAAEEKADRFVLVSAIGADARSDSEYARTKALGEAAATAAFPKAVILRPSIVFGTEDGYFNKMAGLAKLLPALPLIGGDTRFQPVYVDDVAAAVAEAATGGAKPGVYELGGPEVLTQREMLGRMLAIIQRRRLLLPVPFALARIMSWFLDMAQFLTGGLFSNGLVTRDQVRLLRHDNVVSENAKTLSAFKIVPVAMDTVLESYLTRFRPHGQFDAITASAKNLRS